MTLTFYRDRSKQWRWTVKARNGRKIANAGEGYRRYVDCKRIAEKLFPKLVQDAPSEPTGPRHA